MRRHSTIKTSQRGTLIFHKVHKFIKEREVFYMPVQFTKDPLPTKNQGERHIPAVLLVDTSGSMSGAPIEELNRGLREFGNALQEDKFHALFFHL